MFQLIILIFIFIHIQICLSLNCYSCSGTTGCNDPFNSLGSGVSTTGTNSANTYCVKKRYIDTYYRDGVSTCSNYWYSSNAYQVCCQSDFCNLTNNLQVNRLIILLLLFILFIIKFN